MLPAGPFLLILFLRANVLNFTLKRTRKPSFRDQQLKFRVPKKYQQPSNKNNFTIILQKKYVCGVFHR